MHQQLALTTPEIDAHLSNGSPVAMGVSGGKDSCALAFALNEFLDGVGHAGPRVLIHSDLGRVEWKESLPTCHRLADALGLELMTVQRHAGDMMDRWLSRWDNNVARYANLECVKLILPWSTPSMRFCTSELKTDIICRALAKRFPGSVILSASGVRREESSARAKSPIAKSQKKLESTKFKTSGFDWNPILHWSKVQVLDYLELRNFTLHEAYTTYGSSRVSCCYCILASKADLKASTTCSANLDVYREMVQLEIRSSFSFQDASWLGDIAPQLLNPELRQELHEAKGRAARRMAAEAKIPAHLLYCKGWPTCVPSVDEAELLCEVRREVANAVGIVIDYSQPEQLIARYEELMAAKGRDVGESAAPTQTMVPTRGGGLQATMNIY